MNQTSILSAGVGHPLGLLLVFVGRMKTNI